MSHEKFIFKPEDRPELPNEPKAKSTQLPLPLKETLASKELEKHPGLVITISGLPGSGSTTLADNLGACLDVYPGQIGIKLRKKHVEPIVGFAPRDPIEDKKTDDQTARRMRRTGPGKVRIVEAKLSGWLATQIKNSMQDRGPHFLRILMWAPEEVRAQRVYERDSLRYPEMHLTQQRASELTRQREEGDLENYQNAHHQMIGINPLDPNTTWSQDNYDLIIDTSKLTQTGSLLVVLNELLTRQLLPRGKRELLHQMTGSPQYLNEASIGEQIFPSIQ